MEIFETKVTKMFWIPSSACLLFCFAAFSQEHVPSPPEATTLEEKVAANPEDVQARSSLLSYYTSSFNSSPAIRVEARRKHILWLIEHHPEAPVLAEPAGNLAAGGPLADPEGVAAATEAWQAQLAKPNPGSRVLMHAISFFECTDLAAALRAVERGIQMYPNERYFLQLKGAVDAGLVAGVKSAPFNAPPQLDLALAKSPEAERARAEMLASHDIHFLDGALERLPRFQGVWELPSNDMALKLLELTESLAKHLQQIDPTHSAARQALASVYTNAGLFAQDPVQKRQLLEKAVANTSQPKMKFYAFCELAEAYLKTGDREKAAATANDLLSLADGFPRDWNYGNAIHRGNLVLGRIALDRGDLSEAKERLLAAGRTKGSPQLDSFGPQNWELAQELLARGEKTTVLEYLGLCGSFWKEGNSYLDNWSAAIRAGATPELGGRNPASGPSAPQTQLVGKVAPPFVLEDLEGQKHALESYRGKVVLLDFWATWCEPCRVEMPDLEKLNKELSPEIVILAVDGDEEKDVVSTFIREGKYTMPVLLTQGTDVTNRYSINAYPTLVALDKTGHVSGVALGGQPETKIREMIASATTEAPMALLSGSNAHAQLDLPKLARQAYDISADQASRLEENLIRDPNDLAARAQLLGYYFAAGRRQTSPEVARQARLRHILWLVQNHPESDLAGMPPATIDPTGQPLADQEGYEKVKALWLERAEKYKDNPVVLAHASWFFKLPDKPIAARLLKRAQAVDPGNRNWSAGLGFVYAAGIVGLTGMNENGFATNADPAEAHGSFAQQAREELAKSQDVALVGTAGDRLWFWGTILSASGKAPPDYLALSEQLFRKAQALDPGNQEWAQMLARLHAQPAPKAASPEDAPAGEKSYPLRVALQYARKSSSGTTIAQQALITDTESQDKYRADIECDGTLRRVWFNARWDKNEHKEMKLPATEGGNDGHEVRCTVQTLTRQPR